MTYFGQSSLEVRYHCEAEWGNRGSTSSSGTSTTMGTCHRLIGPRHLSTGRLVLCWVRFWVLEIGVRCFKGSLGSVREAIRYYYFVCFKDVVHASVPFGCLLSFECDCGRYWYQTARLFRDVGSFVFPGPGVHALFLVILAGSLCVVFGYWNTLVCWLAGWLAAWFLCLLAFLLVCFCFFSTVVRSLYVV